MENERVHDLYTEFHGLYSPWDHRVDTTERLSLHFMISESHSSLGLLDSATSWKLLEPLKNLLDCNIMNWYKTFPAPNKIYGTWYLEVDSRILKSAFHSLNMFVEGLLCHGPLWDMQVGMQKI